MKQVRSKAKKFSRKNLLETVDLCSFKSFKSLKVSSLSDQRSVISATCFHVQHVLKECCINDSSSLKKKTKSWKDVQLFSVISSGVTFFFPLSFSQITLNPHTSPRQSAHNNPPFSTTSPSLSLFLPPLSHHPLPPFKGTVCSSSVPV